MTAQLSKDSIDIGIVTTNAPECLAFYRDVLGFEDAGESPVPGGTIHQLLCGTSSVKLMTLNKLPRATAAPGGMRGSTGYRYFTISVTNLEEVLAACAAVGRSVVVPPTELGSGSTIAIVEDPDGNWVELLRAAR